MKHKILLVEDEAILALNQAKTIKSHGFEVVIVYTGEEAIEKAYTDNNISLILMDIDLSNGIDGTQAAQTILKNRDIPIAFISSHTEQKIVEKTEGITSYGYIVKNSGETVLIASIKMALRLYEAHLELKKQKENLKTALIQQKETEKELVKKSEELEAYFQSSLDMLCIANTKGEFIRLNPEWEKKLGYKISELEGRSFMDFVHRDDKEKTFQAISQLKNQKEVLTFVNRYLCKDGSYRWIEWRSKPIGDTIYAAARDITARKHIEQKLKKSERWYKSLFYKTPLGAFQYNKNGEIIECNDNFVHIIGSSRKKLIGLNMLTQLQDTRLINEVKKSLNTGNGYYEGEYTSVTADKTTPVRVFLKGIQNAEGHLDSGIGLIEETTERKENEEKLRKTLLEKDGLMKELNHRVKNNLNMVSSLINLKNSEIENDLSDIKHQVDAIRIIHEKLYQTEDVTHIAVKEYIQQLLETVFSSFSQQQVTIINKIEDTIIPTNTAVPLGLLINEVATNAIKHGFNTREDARFEITMGKDTSNKEYILTLSNTGNPFPKEIELNNSKTLGLELITTLVKQINGTIQLKKKPSPLFTIKFPIPGE